MPSAKFIGPNETAILSEQHHSINFKEYSYILYSSGEDELYNIEMDSIQFNDLSDQIEFQPEREYLRSLLFEKLGDLRPLKPSFEKLFYGDFEQDLNGWKPSIQENGIEIINPNEKIDSKHVRSLK